VTEHYNHRISVFGTPPVSANTTTWGKLKALYR
jgi:hypothetical protein